MVKISQYKKALGVWKHTIGEVTHEIVPEEDDNYAFLRAKDESQKQGSTELLYKQVGGLYFSMVMRSKPSLPEEDQADLKRWIGVNINQIIEDFLIAFNWTTKEKLDEITKNSKSQN